MLVSELMNHSHVVTNFSCVFQNCTSLTSIPVGLFDGNEDIIREMNKKNLLSERRKKLERLESVKNSY
jgi:hypothetical protein